MTREELAVYIAKENEANGYGVEETHIASVMNIIFYVGVEMYRPLVRLLLGNWKELDERIAGYGEDDWKHIETLKERMDEDRQDESQLTAKEVAMFFEVLEGEDTANQLSTNERPITAAELRRIRGR